MARRTKLINVRKLKGNIKELNDRVNKLENDKNPFQPVYYPNYYGLPCYGGCLNCWCKRSTPWHVPTFTWGGTAGATSVV